jgi:hypothetical protein
MIDWDLFATIVSALVAYGLLDSLGKAIVTVAWAFHRNVELESFDDAMRRKVGGRRDG